MFDPALLTDSWGRLVSDAPLYGAVVVVIGIGLTVARRTVAYLFRIANDVS
jgi:hypothetical protein